MFQILEVGDEVYLNIPEIYRSMLPEKTKERLSEQYNTKFIVERIDEETGYVYLKDLIGSVPFNHSELIRTKSKALSEEREW